MKSFLSLILSLVVCSVLLFGSTKCDLSTDILPSPTATPITSTTSKHSPNSTINNTSLITHSPNASTVHVTPTLSMTSIFTSVLPNKTTNHTIIVSTAHPLNTSVYHNSTYMTLTSVIMSSSAGNGSIHNSTVHPTPLPTHSINMSSTVVMSSSIGNSSIHNSTVHPTPLPTHYINMSSTVVHNASSRIHPTMTPSPSPATSVVPSSSVPPTPPPLPRGRYSVTKNGKKCLLLSLSLEFTITYKNNSGSKLQTTVKMPSNGKADGICEQSLSSIRISWPYYSFEAYFHTQKAANGHWNTINVTVTAQTKNNSDFVNVNDTIIRQSVTTPGKLEWLSGSVGKSLNCSVDEKLKTESMTATIKWLRIQPFEVGKDGDFAKQADHCDSTPAPPTSSPHTKSKNTVAIAVGCSLAALVLIVLIGYFIGKRVRSRPGTGYRKL